MHCKGGSFLQLNRRGKKKMLSQRLLGLGLCFGCTALYTSPWSQWGDLQQGPRRGMETVGWWVLKPQAKQPRNASQASPTFFTAQSLQKIFFPPASFFLSSGVKVNPAAPQHSSKRTFAKRDVSYHGLADSLRRSAVQSPPIRLTPLKPAVARYFHL